MASNSRYISNIGTGRTVPKSPLQKLELLDYSRGLNSFTNNDVVPKDQLVHITDSRISTFGRIKTRKGCDFYSDAAGETLDHSQTSATGEAEQAVTLTTWYAVEIVPTATGRLTKLELNVYDAGTGQAPLMVEIRSDNSGAPSSTILAQSSIAENDIPDSVAYTPARFIEAPQVTLGTTYWAVVYIQIDGAGQYQLNSTTNATTTLSSSDSGTSWDATAYDLQFKSYVSTDSPTLGLYRSYKSDGTKKSLLAHGTSLYTVNDATGALTAIKTGLSASSTKYRFETVNDAVYYVNGFDAPRKWDFTTEASAGGSPGIAKNIILHKNQLFFMDASDPAKIFWSDIADFETFTSTNFLYVPAPKSSDPLTGWVVLNDNLYLFTSKTKWALYGSDGSNFVLRKSTGLKGAPSQEAIASTRNHAFFLSDDGIYQFDGATDKNISIQITDKIEEIVSSENTHLQVHLNRLYVFYTPTGQGNNKQCLVYNINYDSWESIDLNTYVNHSAIFSTTQDNGQFIQGSSLVGQAFYGENSSNTYNNLGKKLSWELRTRYEHFDFPANKKRVKRWYPRFASQTGDYTVDCYYDKNFANNPTISSGGQVDVQGVGSTWGGGELWGGGATWGASYLINPRLSIPSSSQYTQVRYLRSGVNQPVEFLGHTFYYQIKRAR